VKIGFNSVYGTSVNSLNVYCVLPRSWPWTWICTNHVPECTLL